MGGIIELSRSLADRDAPVFGEEHPHDEATELRPDFGHHQLMRSDEQVTCQHEGRGCERYGRERCWGASGA